MLFSVGGQQEIELPHKDDYDQSQNNLTDDEKVQLAEIFKGLIDSGKIHSSMALGALSLEKDATLKALLLKVANGNKAEIGRYFGLYLYNAIKLHKEKWFFKRSSGRLDTGGYTYWRENYRPPKPVNW